MGIATPSAVQPGRGTVRVGKMEAEAEEFMHVTSLPDSEPLTGTSLVEAGFVLPFPSVCAKRETVSEDVG